MSEDMVDSVCTPASPAPNTFAEALIANGSAAGRACPRCWDRRVISSGPDGFECGPADECGGADDIRSRGLAHEHAWHEDRGAPTVPETGCWECRRTVKCDLDCPSSPLQAKRREMHRKLHEVRIDPAKLKPRTISRGLLVNLTHEGREEMRFALAKDILLAMIDNGGDKQDKVRAAVEYADLLLAELAL